MLALYMHTSADDLWGLLDIQASSAAEQYALQHSQQEASMHLRHLIGAATGGGKPLLSDAAQDFLGEREQAACVAST
jgi:hypothetical protein